MNAFGSGSASQLSEAERFDQLSRQIEAYRASRIIIAMGEPRGRLPVEVLLRFMVDGADRDDNHRPAEKADDRFTRMGKLLPQTRIDELPQLVNILRGEVYFVGSGSFVPNQEREC
jgi:hypothetical protein